MDTVKATINVKEGIVELEGPLEFVEKYLNLYRPDASKWKSAISQEGEIRTKEVAPAKRTRTRVPKPKGTPSCLGRIRTLINENYFKEPHTSTEVIDWLKEQKGAIYDSSPVTAALNNLIKSSTLRRFKESGKGPYKYCNP